MSDAKPAQSVMRPANSEVKLTEDRAEFAERAQETFHMQPKVERLAIEGGLRLKGSRKSDSPDAPLFTIITAVFNGEQNLEETILSVGGQTYQNVEYIIIDGGSSDGTLDVIRRNEHCVDYWISEPDFGIYDAWNKGVRLARGSWIGFLGAGDSLKAHSMEQYASFLADRPNLEYVSARVELFDNSGATRIIGQPWEWDRFRHYMCAAHVGSVHARRLFERYGLYDKSYKASGDYELLLRAGANLHAGYMDAVVARMLAGGISAANIKSLIETRDVKIRNRATGRVGAYWDHWVALAKWYVRSMLGRL